MKRFWLLLTPNGSISRKTRLLISIGTVCAVVFFWQLGGSRFASKPVEASEALIDLFVHQQFSYDLVSSLLTYVQAMLLSLGISLVFAYSTVLPIMRPTVSLITKARFLSLTGIALLFMSVFGGGHGLKLALLAFCLVPQLVTSIGDAIAAIPREHFDLARTLRMGPWSSAWEVVIVGHRHEVLKALKQNHSIAWMMLPFVEGRIRTDGGIGAVLSNEDRHVQLEAVFAIVILLIVLGWLIDVGYERLLNATCRYAMLGNERKDG